MLARKSYKINFDETVWKEERDQRKYMIHELETTRSLIGCTKREVIQKLGDEFNDDNSDRWTYYIGTKNVFGSKMYLVIYFGTNKTVFKIEKR